MGIFCIFLNILHYICSANRCNLKYINSLKLFKTMRKLTVIIAATLFAMSTAVASAFSIYDDERTIRYDQLPEAARHFISKHFPTEQPSYTIEDKELTHSEYTVVMSSGTKIEFDHKGEWTDVDCRNASVPESVVPSKIANYVSRHYPSSHIYEISKERNGWEVQLTGGLELMFDNNYRLVKVDD